MATTNPVGWNNLPVELILEIIEFFDFRTLKHASRINKKWFKLTQRRIERKAVLHCNAAWIPEDGGRAVRIYKSLVLTDLHSSQMIAYLKYVDPNGRYIRVLSLSFIAMTYDEFFRVIEWSKRLSKLSLTLIRFTDAIAPTEKIIRIKYLEMLQVNNLPTVFQGLKRFSTGPTAVGTDFTKTLIAMNRQTLTSFDIKFDDLQNYTDLLGIEKLKTLELQHWRGNASDLCEMFGHYPNLRHLSLPCGERVADETVASIVYHLPKLGSLKLNNCHGITDEGFAMVRNMKNLSKLEFDIRGLTEAGFEQAFSQEMPKFAELTLSHFYTPLHDEVFAKLLKNAPNLTKLDMQGCTKLTVKSFILMADSLKKLSSVTFNEIKIAANETITETIPEFQSLQYLDFRYSTFNDAILYRYLNAPKLKTLKINVKKFTNANANSFVARFPLLEYFVFKCPSLTDEGVDIICKSLPRLRYLSICNSSGLTVDSLESVVTHCKQLSSCDVNLQSWFATYKNRNVKHILMEIGHLRSPAMITYNKITGKLISGLKNEFCEIRFSEQTQFIEVDDNSDDEDL